MLQIRIRYVQILSLLCAMGRLSLAFPAQTPPAFTDVRHLQVKIPHSGLISTSLGSSVTLPCLVSLSSTPVSSSSPTEPRIKWTVVSGGVETQILVARGQRVKINEAYRERAALSNYTSSPDDLSLWLADLRTSDSGHYRCEVQQGLEDAGDLVQLKVKGVVFHYRDALGRYAFSFHQAQRVCEAIGAKIASPDQLLAAYYDGYEQCDAGWLSDQSVRYPIQVPREGCYGDMNGQPGVRNYGTMDAEDLYDVYCYIDQFDGELFYESVPQQLMFSEAQSYCRGAEGELATTAQLYLAWSEGLDRCSPGWLSDGSVRYPIIAPRERCGGLQAGVKSVYRFSNQTGFPEPSSLHDVYCFKGNKNVATVSPMDYMYVATESDDIGQDLVILTEPDQELQLNHKEEHVEREVQSVLESFPIYSRPSTDESLISTPTVTSDTTESKLNATSTPTLLQLFNETSTPTEMDNNTEHPTAVTSTFNSTDAYDSTQNMTVLSNVTNEKDSNHTLVLTFYESELENTTAFLEPYTPHQMQRVLDSNPEEPEASTPPSQSPEQSQETTDFITLQANFSEMNSTGKDNVSEEVLVTSDPMLQVKLKDAVVDEPLQVTLSTDSPREEEVLTQTAQSTKLPIKTLQFLWIPVEGSGGISQDTDLNVGAASFITESDSSTLDSSTDRPPSVASSGTTVTATHITPTSESYHSDKVDFYSISEQPWQSSIFRQEGSTSIETEDTVTVENEEKEPHLHVSGVSLPSTIAPEVWSANSTTPAYWTSSPRMHLEALTDSYQEASGHEPETLITALEDVSPTFGDKDVPPTLPEDVSLKPTVEAEYEKVNFEDEVSTDTTTPEHLTETQNHGEEDEVNPALNENITPTAEEVTEGDKFTSTHEEEVTVLPFDSQTANWSPLTTTTGPQESLNSLEYSRKTSTAAPESPSSTDPPTKTSTITVKTTTYWSRRSWSSTTVEPKAHHETAEPQKVTAHIPPVNHGRADFEFSLTQPPTLLILPNERAAVGGVRKASDDCLDDPCLNGGTCTDRGGEIKCLCLPTYGGQFCQTDLERCELGWDKFQGFCYRHFSQRLSWEVAEQHCRMLGAHLVSIMSPEEQTYLNSYYKEYQWTGLNDKTLEDDFRWSDGNPILYENWYRGQPDSYFLSGEDCVVMVWHDDGRWSDVPCNYHLAYTCKKSTCIRFSKKHTFTCFGGFFHVTHTLVTLLWKAEESAKTCKAACGPPPKVRNASIFGKVHQRYEMNTAVRYYCAQGFQQRLKPLIRCLSGGKWEKPQIMCIPEAGNLTQNPEETSPTTNFAAIEDEFESTKESPQYWDIKF